MTVFDIYTITTQELALHPEYFSSDGFHPSDAGYEIVGAADVADNCERDRRE